MTEEGFCAMERSVAKECKDLPDGIGISVALWRLRELLHGYRYAIDNGYSVAKVVPHASPEGNEVPVQERHEDTASPVQG